jgi:uncharacterized protein (DUF58 family)
MLLIVLGGLWLVCYLWVRSLARNLSLDREMRFGWTQVGDRLEERFTLTNSSLAPALWVEVGDKSSMPDYDTSRGTGIESKSASVWRTQGYCTRRGVFSLGPTELNTGDPFGVYTVNLRFESTQSLLVLPPIIPLPDIDVAPGGRAGEGRPRPNALERTVSAASVREYTNGDSMHWIHWPTSVRRNSLYVRLFESTPASDWWVILDMDRQVHVGQGEKSTTEHAISLAASLVDQGIRDGKSVGFTSHGENLVWLPPAGGATQRWNILRAMALMGPGPLPLAQLLEHMRPDLSQTASLVVVTASLDDRWVNQLILLTRRGTVPTVLLIDPGSYTAATPQRGAEAMVSLLTSLGVTAYRITPELFERPEARPGHMGEWELRVMPNGRVVRIGRQQDESWRPLE